MGNRLIRIFIIITATFHLAAFYTEASLDKKSAADRPGVYPKAFEDCKRLADQGDPNAQFNLGVIYETGQGTSQDFSEAVKWYSKSADQGVPDAQLNLGVMFAVGKGVRQDYAEAVKWYRKAADQHLAEAQYNLGTMYGNGQGVKEDHAEEFKWYLKAANQGFAVAQFNVGVMYAKGDGAPQSYTLAYMWFHLAAGKRIEGAREYRDKCASQMNQAQIAEAQRLAREWRPKVD